MIRNVAKNLALDGKTVKYKILHGVTALLFIAVLSSIYLMRNKEDEIAKRVESRLKNNENIISKK